MRYPVYPWYHTVGVVTNPVSGLISVLIYHHLKTTSELLNAIAFN
jgi:hypothetical protein